MLFFLCMSDRHIKLLEMEIACSDVFLTLYLAHKNGTLKVHLFLTEFISLNPSLFSAYCHPVPVSTHVDRMKQMNTWGTQTEILAMALCFNKPVYVALQRKPDQTCKSYYWARSDIARVYTIYEYLHENRIENR